jgi:hypothetical protein
MPLHLRQKSNFQVEAVYMVIFPEKLNFLRESARKLRDPLVKGNEKIKQEALKIISELNIELRKGDLKLEEWNEVFEAVQPYVKLDLLSQTGIISNLFASFFSPKNAAENLVSFIEEKRSEHTIELFNKERARATQDYQQFIQNILASKQKGFDPDAVRDYILEVRATNPRLILSVQDEIVLLRELINESLKKYQEDKQKAIPITPPKALENLTKMLVLLQGNLFSLNNYFEKASQQKRHETGVVILKPDPKTLSPKDIESLKVQRLYRLENLEAMYKNLGGDPNQRVASKCFELTYGWYVGTFQFNEVDSPFELEMQKIGQEYGIRVISDLKLDSFLSSIDITEENKTDLMLDCESLVQLSGTESLGAFPQDFIDFSKNGEVRIPRMRNPREKTDLPSHLQKAREDRSKAWKQIISDLGGGISSSIYRSAVRQ